MILDTRARLGSYAFAVTVHYDQIDAPDLIEFRFHTRRPVRWLIGRDLLANGLMEAVGDGDLRIQPSPDTDEVAIRVRTPEGVAVIRLPWNPIAGFVRATCDRVPRGTEYDGLDWNRLLPAAGGAG